MATGTNDYGSAANCVVDVNRALAHLRIALAYLQSAEDRFLYHDNTPFADNTREAVDIVKGVIHGVDQIQSDVWPLVRTTGTPATAGSEIRDKIHEAFMVLDSQYDLSDPKANLPIGVSFVAQKLHEVLST
ncbi:MAG: hypothetical protein GWN93_14190 [Deltaproteobacteria bacterium]|nr:hypothetical protein [Deltaproteobacteria bacterium]